MERSLGRGPVRGVGWVSWLVVGAGYGVGMVSPAAAVPEPTGLGSGRDPRAIRACLPAGLAAEFDREWELVLEQAKQSQELAGVYELVAKWRHTAHLEAGQPGAYGRLLGKAEQIRRAGHNPDAGSVEDLRSLIRDRLGS